MDVTLPRLSPEEVVSFRPDGTLMDLAAPDAKEIDFLDMANGLSKIARWNGRNPGPAFSVAQHATMGAQALFNETGDAEAAAAFLLHDGHEYLIGDLVTPMALLMDAYIAQHGRTRFEDLASSTKISITQAWDNAIYLAASVDPIPHWSLIKQMDLRMARAEALALFGAKTEAFYGDRGLPHPKTTGGLKPWGAAKAEERFLDAFARFVGFDPRRGERAS